jgi:hypothetical protein
MEWKGPEALPDVTLIRCGGHFAGTDLRRRQTKATGHRTYGSIGPIERMRCEMALAMCPRRAAAISTNLRAETDAAAESL